MPTEPVAPIDGRVKCSVCQALVWRARFGRDWRLVEPAANKVVPGSYAFTRPAGHVALTFPLALPGCDVSIVGAIVRKPTKYRIHQHAAFSAESLWRKDR
jgi:hypothetical protein